MNAEIIIGILVLCFATVVVYLAFRLESKKSSEIMQELKSIRELLEKLNNKASK
jgi:Na+/melibiose symporter-like transporter